MRQQRQKMIGVVLIVLILGGVWFHLHQRSNSTLTLFGNVDIREVQMAFRQSGRILKLEVDEGDSVEAGQLLAELDPVPFQHIVNLARAEAQKTEAELQKRLKGSRWQEIERAQEGVNQAAAALTLAEQDLSRQKQIEGTGASTEHTLDQTRSQRDQARANLAAARQELALRKEGFRSEDIVAAKANHDASLASLAQAETALADTHLLAPNQGSILSRIREPGSMVSSHDPVLSLSIASPIYVRAYVAETDLGRVVPGTRVLIHSDSIETAYEGQIGFVSPKAEFTPKSVETTELRTDLVYRLRIVVQAPNMKLRQGMPVTISVPLIDASH